MSITDVKSIKGIVQQEIKMVIIYSPSFKSKITFFFFVVVFFFDSFGSIV